MTKPKEAGQWRLFSSLLEDAPDEDKREQVGRYLLDRIASGATATGHYRYFWAGDTGRLSDTGAPRTGHRCDRLPDEFWRLGRFMNAWQFSAVTFGEDTLVELEIFFPYVTAETSAAPPAEVKIGRPTLRDRIQAEGRRLQDSGARYESCSALARAVQPKFKDVELRTVRGHLAKVWIDPNKKLAESLA